MEATSMRADLGGGSLSGKKTKWAIALTLPTNHLRTWRQNRHDQPAPPAHRNLSPAPTQTGQSVPRTAPRGRILEPEPPAPSLRCQLVIQTELAPRSCTTVPRALPLLHVRLVSFRTERAHPTTFPLETCRTRLPAVGCQITLRRRQGGRRYSGVGQQIKMPSDTIQAA